MSKTELNVPNKSFFEKNPKVTKLMIFLLFLILFISIVIGIFELFHFNFFNFVYKIYLTIFESLNDAYKNNTITFYISIYIIQTLTISLMLPFYLVFNWLIAYILKTWYISFIFLLSSSLIGSNFNFIICNFGFGDFFSEKIYKNNLLMLKLKEIFNNNELKYSFVVRFIIMPLGLKDYILCSFNVKYKYFILSSFVSYSIFCFKNALWGSYIKDLKEIFIENKKWENKNSADIFALVISILLIIITLSSCIVLSYWATNTYNKLQEYSNIEKMENNDSLSDNEELKKII